MKYSSLALGGFLLALNIIGFTHDLRPEGLQEGVKYQFEEDLTLSFSDAMLELSQKPKLTQAEQVMRLVYTVNSSIGHYWPRDTPVEFHLQVPPTENYVLWLLGVFAPQLEALTGRPFVEIYRGYEFYDWNLALQRGLGLCSQHATILDSLLKDRGFDSRIVQLDGHVLNEVDVMTSNKETWLLDPDYGLVLPFSLATAEANPIMVRQWYESVTTDEAMLDHLVDIYGSSGNSLVASSEEYYGWHYILIEVFSYWLKWLIPLSLLLFSVYAHRALGRQ